MARSFIFGLGAAPSGANLSGRRLDIYKIDDVPASSVHGNSYSGTTEFSSEVMIGPGRHKAVLVDSRDNGDSKRQFLTFDGNADWPSHVADESELRIVSIEEASSSSSLSSSSST